MSSDRDHDLGRILTERDGPVWIMTIDRPAKRNGFTPQMMAQLGQAYSALEQDPQLRVGLLCANGGHFTGGLDLPRWAQIIREGRSMVPPGCVDPFDLSEAGPEQPRRSKPLVVAISGYCYTLGIELMLAADVVVAADDTRLSQLEVKRGIMATGGATTRIAERAGLGNALLYLLTGDEFSVADAYRMGLVQKVVPVGRERAEAKAIAQRIADAAPLAVQATLANARLAAERGPLAAVAQFQATNQRLAQTDDAREGVQSFIERRAPRFSGN